MTMAKLMPNIEKQPNCNCCGKQALDIEIARKPSRFGPLKSALLSKKSTTHAAFKSLESESTASKSSERESTTSKSFENESTTSKSCERESTTSKSCERESTTSKSSEKESTTLDKRKSSQHGNEANQKTSPMDIFNKLIGGYYMSANRTISQAKEFSLKGTSLDKDFLLEECSNFKNALADQCYHLQLHKVHHKSVLLEQRFNL